MTLGKLLLWLRRGLGWGRLAKVKPRKVSSKMTRFTIAAVFTLSVLPATQAYASDAGHHCAPTAEIVQMAVTARALGAEQDATQADILANDAVEERYAPAVPSLVEWVYTLPEDQLTDEVAVSFEEACGANIN